MSKLRPDHKFAKGLAYVAHGNPPHSPGLFYDGERIAWWPAGVEPTQVVASRVFEMWEYDRRPLGPRDVLGIISEFDPSALMDCRNCGGDGYGHGPAPCGACDGTGKELK